MSGAGPHGTEAPPTLAPSPPVLQTSLLDVAGLSKSFRGLKALTDYDLDLPAGTIHGVIGPNGAGKTTLFNVLSGFLRPTRGTIAFEGPDITGCARVRGRSARDRPDVPEHPAVRRPAGHRQRQGRAPARTSPRRCSATLLSTPRVPRERARARPSGRSSCSSSSASTGQRDRLARHLPYGDQRRLEIARAVATKPRILLLDEPNAGMNPVETQELLRPHPPDPRRAGHHGRPRRPRHPARDEPVRPDPGPQLRPDHRRRARPAAVRSDPAVIAAYLGQGPRMLLELTDVHVRYGSDPRAPGRLAARRRGRARRADRLERRRQEHDPADDLRAAAAERRARSRSRAPTSPTRLDRPDRRARDLPLPRGPPDLRQPDRRREPPARGGLAVAMPPRRRRGPRDGPRAVPAAEGAARAGRRHAVRRRAADARDRAGADEPAPPAPARRAVARASRRSWSSGSSTTIAELKRQGRTILLVEQNVHQALDVADRAYVLETGPDHARRAGRRPPPRPEGRAVVPRRRRRRAVTDYAIQQVVNALSAGSLYALMAVGLAMVFGILRLINFAHGDLMMIAAYLAVFCLGAGLSLRGRVADHHRRDGHRRPADGAGRLPADPRRARRRRCC